MDTSAIADTASNLQAVQNEYGVPLYMGMVDNVDKAFDEINNKLQAAGIEVYEKAVREQLEVGYKSPNHFAKIFQVR